ncbi:MAG TPA: response regulator [Desulfobacterales bacterium]
MVKNVLIVDDDTEMLATLKNGFARYEDTFAVIAAEDGVEAIEVLKKRAVSLVVTDLKMPRLDGFALLQHIMEHYPDIPVIVITGYSTPEMESMARSGGAVGYIAKPFMLETLAHQILGALRQESEGGTLHSVSSGIFLQLVEMEQKTCTVRLEDKSTGRSGVLFFQDGTLLDARVGQLQGKPAAYEIFAWDKVTISIQNVCPNLPDRIRSELQALILEASRRKDESLEVASGPIEADPPGETRPDSAAGEGHDTLVGLREFLEKNCGGAVSGVHPAPSWEPLLERLSDMGKQIDSGAIQVCYIDRDDGGDSLLLPGSPPVEAGVKARTPRDRLLTLLAGYSKGDTRKTI